MVNIPLPIGSMYGIYMLTFTINIPQMLAYIPAPWILWVLGFNHPKLVVQDFATAHPPYDPRNPQTLAQECDATHRKLKSYERNCSISHQLVIFPLYANYVSIIPSSQLLFFFNLNPRKLLMYRGYIYIFHVNDT